MDIREQIKAGPKRARKSVDVCLRLDLVSQWEELSQRLESEQEGKKLSDSKSPLVAEMDALVEQMDESTYTLTMEALSPDRWSELVAAHPPREDNPGDQRTGINLSTFYPEAIHESLVDPELDSEEVAGLLGMLSGGQFDEVTIVLWTLNRGKVDIPLSSSVWLTPESSDATSKLASDSASATNASAAGSRKKPRSSSTSKGA